MITHLHNLAVSLKPLLITILGVSIVHLHAGVSFLAVCIAAAYTIRKWVLLEKEVKAKAEAELKKLKAEAIEEAENVVSKIKDDFKKL